METHFYTMEFFCPFTRIFLYTSRKIPYNFFLCCARTSRIMKAKKSRNSRGKTRAMETHFYIMEFFFFFHQNFPMNIQIDSLLFFLMPCSYFKKNECKKISTFEREHSSTVNVEYFTWFPISRF